MTDVLSVAAEARATQLLKRLLDNLIWVLLALSILSMTFLSTSFFTIENLFNLGVNSTALGILVIGQVLCLLIGRIDVSVESTLALAALTGALMAIAGFNPYFSMFVVLGVGAGVGLVNGWAIAYLGANFFMQTLAMNIILRGLMLVVTGGVTIYGMPTDYRVFGATSLFGIPTPIILLALLYGIFVVVLERRRWGRSVYLIGSNERAAFVSGLATKQVVLGVYVLSGVLAAVAGLIVSTRLDSVNNELGKGMVFEVLAAAVMGGVSLVGGKGRLLGALGGVLFLGCVTSILTWLRVDAFVVQVTRGGIILLAIVIDAARIILERRLVKLSAAIPSIAEPEGRS